jgi:hypothetical protein
MINVFDFEPDELPRMREVVKDLPFLTVRDLLTLIEALNDQRIRLVQDNQLWPEANDDLIEVFRKAIEDHFGRKLEVNELHRHTYGAL